MRKFIITLLLLSLLISPSPGAAARGQAQKRQNTAANKHDLTRIKNLSHLRRLIDKGLLVPVDDTDAYVISDDLGEKDPDHRHLFKHARPYTRDFLDNLLGEAHKLFGSRYTITSLVRTADYQRTLCKSNGNAICGSTGWKRSSHLTGATVDISYVGMSKSEQRWFRGQLEKHQRNGKIIYIHEVNQACFHVMVLPNYSKKRTP